LVERDAVRIEEALGYDRAWFCGALLELGDVLAIAQNAGVLMPFFMISDDFVSPTANSVGNGTELLTP
jgi:hypothetical protein